MKRLIILLFIFSIFITGCSITRVRDNDIDYMVDYVLKSKSKLRNANFEGYDYYVPKGLIFLDKQDYNSTFRDQYNNNYYLYVDVVSSYHKVTENYEVNNNAYYSRAITDDGKFGYLEINKISNKYFIEAMYNYTKIESYVDELYLYDALSNISMILSSVKFNRKVLDTIIGENILNYKEENYNIFKTKKNSTNFLDYVEEYDSQDTTKQKDEDNLQIDEGE